MTNEEDGGGTKHRGRYRRMFGREAREARQLVDATVAGDADQAREALGEMARDMRDEVMGRDSYVPVFFLTLILVVVSPMVEGTTIGQIATSLFAAGTLVIALHRSTLNPRNLTRLTYIILGATALAMAATILQANGHSGRLTGALASGAFLFVLLITLPAVLLQTFLHTRVNLNTLAAAMSAYLLLGLLFTTAFRFISIVDTQPFFAQDHTIDPGDMEYFSFITITTVGYGDLTPGTGAARAGAVGEAVVGQIFLVTIVARVVGALGRQRPMGQALREARTGEQTDEPDGLPATPLPAPAIPAGPVGATDAEADETGPD